MTSATAVLYRSTPPTTAIPVRGRWASIARIAASRAEPLRKAQAVRLPATLRNFQQVCPGQERVADQLASRWKNHGQVSRITSVLFDVS